MRKIKIIKQAERIARPFFVSVNLLDKCYPLLFQSLKGSDLLISIAGDG